MFYKIHFETAIRELGFDHTLFNKPHRIAAQAIGEGLQSTPSEAALMLIAQLPFSQIGPLKKGVLSHWRVAEKSG